MSRSKGIPVAFGGATLCAVLSLGLIFSGAFVGGNRAEADQPPPPPPTYTLTVNKSGGDSTCEVRIDAPVVSAWTSTSVQDTFTAGIAYAPTNRITCPSAYYFSHWESNDMDLHNWEE